MTSPRSLLLTPATDIGRSTVSAPAGRVRGTSMRRYPVTIALVALLLAAAPAQASISIASNAERPALRVDALGNAEVSWTAGGSRRTLRIPVVGLYLPGGRISGADVSRPVRIAGLPFAKVTRRGPDGTLYALQAWRVKAAGPVELHFSRWKGRRTTVELTAEPASGGERLVGRAEFQGKPLTGYSRTNSGIRYRIFAFLDCFACPQTSWRRIAGVAPRADGGFRLLVQPQFAGTRYRVTIAGPNLGRTLAPDASAITTSSLR